MSTARTTDPEERRKVGVRAVRTAPDIVQMRQSTKDDAGRNLPINAITVVGDESLRGLRDDLNRLLGETDSKNFVRLQKIEQRAQECANRNSQRGPAVGDLVPGGEASFLTAEYILRGS